MPEDLLELAIECISIGIKTPLLFNDDVIIFNDDVIINSMISCGFDEKSIYLLYGRMLETVCPWNKL